MAGGSAGCEHEPNWQALYSVIAAPNDPPQRRAKAMVAIRELKPKCQKLLMNPTACHGCPSSPIKEESGSAKEAFQIYGGLIQTIAELLDAAKLGWIKGDDVSTLEFSLMRMYDRAMQLRRTI